MIRVLVPPGALSDGATIVLAPEETHHLQVRRVGDASLVEALDTRGFAAEGTVARVERDWAFTVQRLLPPQEHPHTILAVGAGDRDRFIEMVERATELGVSRIIPLESERARQVATRLRNVDKARRAAAEACKQCGNAWAPVIVNLMSLDEFLTAQLAGRWLLADAGGDACPSLARDEAVGWLIGPEGGFTLAEMSAIHRALAPASVTLGRHTLRFETAAAAAAALTADRRARD